MKKKIGVTCIVFSLIFFFNKKNSIEDKREKHSEFLKNSPHKENLKLSKKERKAKGLPPNKYFDREWELTMNPNTGEPEPEKVLELQTIQHKKGISKKTPGDAVDNKWVERGPNNVGGRTRVLLFDPNDSENKRVFSGAVSGGLWVNNDITNENSAWTQVVGVPSNMNVSCLTVDPRDSNIWYLGTGEQYTGGAAVGNGIYKTTNGGDSWTQLSIDIAGVGDLESPSTKLLAGVYYINDIIAWDNGTSTEIFACVGGQYYFDANTPRNILGIQSSGLYRSINSGSTWSRIENEDMEYDVSSFTFYFTPNDLEISADNTLWMGAIASPGFGTTGSGKVYNSTDGEDWSLVTTLENSNRVELAVSSTNANKIYALTQGTTSDGPHIFGTTNSFVSHTELSKPNDSDDGIEADDFTRGQDYYDLMIEVDPTDDSVLYVGGINLFRSDDGANSWEQISKWHTFKPGDYSVVHADQHAMSFRPSSSNQAIFGNDGGVYFANSLSDANTDNTVFTSVNKDYNVTQFYTAAIAPKASDEYFMGGTQDNGTPFFQNPNSQESIDISGGDGAACFVDQDDESYLIVSYIYNFSYSLFNFEIEEWRTINSDESEDGDFINQADLDSNLDILYTNGSGTETQNDEDVFVPKIYRYSNLKTISEDGTALKDTLTDALLDVSPTALKVSPYTIDSTVLLVGTETGKLLRVVNANENPVWTEISGSSFLGSISDIEYGNNENEIFVTFHNYGVSSVWYSDNAGVSWADKDGDLPDIPVKAILNNPLIYNEVIIGTELGVWKTENWSDSSPSWEQTYNGMSDVKVTDLQYRADGHLILASTFGRGLFSGVFSTNELSIQENVSQENEIVVYPTVSKGEFGITSSTKLDIEAIQIFNTTGMSVYDKRDITLEARVKILIELNVPQGIYFVKIKVKDRSYITREIIIE